TSETSPKCSPRTSCSDRAERRLYPAPILFRSCSLVWKVTRSTCTGALPSTPPPEARTQAELLRRRQVSSRLEGPAGCMRAAKGLYFYVIRGALAAAP